MSYPGDQQQPGGWAPPPPPQSPYGPAEDQAAYGGSQHGYGGPYSGHPHDAGSSPGAFGAEQADPYGGGSSDTSFGNSYDSSYDGPSYEPSDPYGVGPGGYGPPGEDGPGSAPGRKRLIIGAAVVAGVVVVGGGSALALTSGGGGSPKSSAPPTTAPPAAKPTASPIPSPTETGRGDRLQSRDTDPVPLRLNEIFKNKSFRSGGRTYVLTARRAERKCAPPTHGVKFRKAIAKAGCNQVLRATFSTGKLIGTIGVLNLRSQNDANDAQVASRLKDAYILPLPGIGSTKKIGQGLSLTTAEVDGHYLIMSWVQYPTGKAIAKSDYAAVTAFVRSTTYGSNLRTALNYRSMEGKPS
jgi:hypothetical protein